MPKPVRAAPIEPPEHPDLSATQPPKRHSEEHKVSPPSPIDQVAPALSTVVFFDHTAKWSGGEISLFNLVTNLDKARFRPVVVLFEDGVLREKLDAAGIATHVVPLANGLNNARKNALRSPLTAAPRQIWQLACHVRALRRILRREKAQLAHCNSLKSDILGGIAARSAGIPTLWHIRDRIADDYLPPRTARVFRRLARLIPTQIITVSDATLKALEMPARRLQTGRARAIHNGTRLEAFANSCEIFERDTILIGMVGRLAPWKGQHIFLEAAAKVRAQCPQVRFQIVGAALFEGDAAYETQLRHQSRDLGLEDVVEWCGFRTDVPQILAQMDVLAHASTTGEPFGQVIIEGMAAGKPVVATDGGGVPEIMVDGETGYLVPMDDAGALAEALLKLCADPERARQMGQAGKKRAFQHFDIRATARNVQLVYEKLLDPQAQRALATQPERLLGKAKAP